MVGLRDLINKFRDKLVPYKTRREMEGMKDSVENFTKNGSLPKGTNNGRYYENQIYERNNCSLSHRVV